MIADGTPVNETIASNLLRHIREQVVQAMDPGSNVTYFGHEIPTLFEVGETILELVEMGTHLNKVEELAEITFAVLIVFGISRPMGGAFFGKTQGF